ncbi:hypothetical protein AGMMS49944_08980 [Spirochaetia bacterium]|nr:hypothetical protein AGMMS49944_08980 [Spirochaetia bacterium]
MALISLLTPRPLTSGDSLGAYWTSFPCIAFIPLGATERQGTSQPVCTIVCVDCYGIANAARNPLGQLVRIGNIIRITGRGISKPNNRSTTGTTGCVLLNPGKRRLEEPVHICIIFGDQRSSPKDYDDRVYLGNKRELPIGIYHGSLPK